MDTVKHTNIVNKWDGKLIIDELKEFADSRGSLTEVWRNDDDKDPGSVMSYWSFTNPYVIRGGHEHSQQTDAFLTINSKMLYQFHYKNESFFFFTEPSKIYRLIVKPGVIHAYRNLSSTRSLTGNFPTSLFMGKDKSEPIDEIRHEHVQEGKPVYIVLGANGRLGKALTRQLLEDSGFYDYNIIPVYEKFNSTSDVDIFLKKLFTPECFTSQNVKVINCLAYTNVQDQSAEKHNFINCELPLYIARKRCVYGFEFYQISTDYVYQKPVALGYHLSPYTKSKQKLEATLLCENMAGIHFLRVSNLFSLEESDTHNIISKIGFLIKEGNEISFDPDYMVAPTDVIVLSKKIAELVKQDTLDSRVNIISDVINIGDICKLFGYVRTAIKPNTLMNNHFDLFRNDAVRCEYVYSYDAILQKVKNTIS